MLSGIMSFVAMNLARMGIGALCLSLNTGACCYVPRQEDPSRLVGVTCLARSEETGFLAIALEDESGHVFDVQVRMPDGAIH